MDHEFIKVLKATKYPYYVEDKLLMRNIIDNKIFFHTMELSQVLMTQILGAAHDELVHNGSTRTYMIVWKLSYWKGWKASVNKHIKQCKTCQKRNIRAVQYAQLHFSTLRLPMQYISIDLIDPFILLLVGISIL